MANYFLTHKAVADLSEIWDYTYEVWSENQADKYYELLIDACELVASHPEKGKIYREIGHNILGFAVGKHILFYQPIEAGGITVVRILHETMDLKRRIQE